MYDRFEQLLKQYNMKPVDLTRKTGIRSTVFSEWKKGKSKPNADKLVKIAKALNTTVEYLVTGEDPSDQVILSPIESEIIKSFRKSDKLHQAMVLTSLGIDSE